MLLPEAEKRASRRRRGRVACAVAFVGLSLFPRGSNATIEEQRARLPPPATCTDKVEGIWAALKFEPRYQEWYEYTLTIKRTSPAADNGSGPLTGEILAHYWTGGAKEEKPPPCHPGGREATVKMPSFGSVDAQGKVQMNSRSFTTDNIACGGRVSYNPDNFSGKIEPERQEFQSVNNDGGRAVNSPTVFRRVRCPDAPHEQQARRGTGTATPPAFKPAVKRSAWGCSP